MRKSSSTKLVSSLLALMTVIQPVRASAIFERSRHAGLSESFPMAPVWAVVAKKIQDEELTGYEDPRRTNEIQRTIFADYLTYLNSVGIQLASFEMSLSISESSQQGPNGCFEDDEENENDLIRNSLNSDITTFVHTYCSSPCKRLKSGGFEMIATFEPSTQTSCEENARRIYQDYNCIENLFDPSSIRLPSPSPNNNSSRPYDLNNNYFKIDIPDTIPSSSFKNSVTETGDRPSIKVPDYLFAKPDKLYSNTDNRNFNSIDTWGNYSKNPFPLNMTPQNGSPKIETEISQEAYKRKTHCESEREKSRYTTVSNPRYNESKFTNTDEYSIKSGLNPLWTTFAPEPANQPKENEEFPIEKPKVCQQYSDSHFNKLRSAYMNISHDAILPILGHWPILNENGQVDDDYIVAIKKIADPLFFNLINQLETSYTLHCGRRINTIEKFMFKESNSFITGARVTNPGREILSGKKTKSEGEDSDNDDQSKGDYQVKTVGHYFSSVAKPVESFVDGFLSADRLGSATPVERRASAIASAVNDGKIGYRDIEAASKGGPYGYRAEDIEKLTRSYLEQNNFSGLLNLAAEFAGGMTSGTLSIGSINLARSLTKSGLKTANLSRLLLSVRDSIRKPLMANTRLSAASIRKSARKFAISSEKLVDFEESVRLFGGDLSKFGEAAANLTKKMDFVFGKATGSIENIQRSTDMLRQMMRIGLSDSAASRRILKESLVRALNDSKSIAKLLAGGRVCRESILSGPFGHLKVESIWEGSKLITIKLKGG